MIIKKEFPMDKLKEFITTHKVHTMIAGAAFVVLVVVGVAIGVSQSMSGKEKVATVNPTEVTEIAEPSETEIAKEEISTETETEVATEISEEVTEENSSESVVATNGTPTNTQATNKNPSNTQTQQPETPQQAPVQETPAPETPAPQTPAPETTAPQAPAPEAPAPAPEEEYDPAAKGMVQDAYGNWVPPTSYYVVKEGICGTKLMSDGSKILGEGAMSHFSDEVSAWRMETYKATGVVPGDEETREFVYNLCMQ